MRRIILLILVSAFLIAADAVAAPVVDNGEASELVREGFQQTVDAVGAKNSPRVMVLPIFDEIDLATAVYAEREMRRAREEKTGLVLVELRTPGGEVGAVLRICEAMLQRDVPRGEKIPVVAFINADAFSGGAYISMACGRIYIASGGKVGAATAITVGAPGMEGEQGAAYSEKMSSALRGEMRSMAKVNGHSPGIAEAMVDRQLGLFEVEIRGRREYLSAVDVKDLPSGTYEVLRTVCEKGKLLTLDYRQAKDTGLAADVLDSRDAVFAALGLKAPVVTVAQTSWSEEFFGALTSFWIRMGLLLLGLMGVYFEFKTPGFGLPGIVGVVCLGLFFFSQYFMGLSGYSGVLVFLIGVALLLIELFVIPGFGVTGVVGILLMVVGLFLGMQPWMIPNIQNPFEMHIFLMNVLTLSVVLVGMAVFAVVLAKVLPSVPFLNRLILTSTGPAGELRSSGTHEEAEISLVGVQGKALSGLHPTGRAEFGERIVDVVTEGGFLEPGTPIVVSRVEGNRVVVQKAE